MKKFLLLTLVITLTSSLWAATFTVDEGTDAWPESGESTSAAPVDPAQFNGNFIEALRQVNAGNADTIVFSVASYNSTKYGSGLIMTASNAVIIGNGVTFSGVWDASLQVQGSNNHISEVLFQDPLWASGNDNVFVEISATDLDFTGTGNSINSTLSWNGDLNVPTDNNVINVGGVTGNVNISGSTNTINSTGAIVGNLIVSNNGNVVNTSSIGNNVSLSGTNNTISPTVINGEVSVLGSSNNVEIIGGSQSKITIGGSSNDISGMNAIDLVFAGSSNTLSDGSFSNTGSMTITGTNNTFENLIIHTGSGIIQVDGNSNNFIGSTFSKNDYTADGPLDIQSDFNLIDDCTFEGNVWLGKIVPANESSDNTISNSTFKGHLEIEGDRNEISDTYVEGNFILGNFLPISADGNLITNVTVGNPTDLNSTSRILFIGSNNVLDNVKLTGTSVIFAIGSNNTYKNSEVHVVENPNVESANLGGIVSESGVELTSGTSLNTIDNVYVHHSSFVVEECNSCAVSTEISGIQVNSNSSSNIVENSRVEGMWNGVYILSSNSTTINDNALSSNVNMGVTLVDTDGTSITGNNTADNFNGIHIYGPASNLDISDNSTSNNGFHGIVVQTNSGSGVEIENNTIFGNDGHGIFTYLADNVVVNGNVIGLDTLGNAVGNGENGIFIQGGSNNQIGVTSGNTVTNSGGNGLSVDGANLNTIVNNTFDGTNTLAAILLYNGSSSNTVGSVGNPNTISNRTSTSAAIVVDGSSSTLNTIEANSTFCNAGSGIELSNGGNANYGTVNYTPSPIAVTINRAESFLSGTAPANAQVHIYDADIQCTALCTADQQEANSQGMTYVTTVSAYASGYWEYPSGDMTKAIVNATDPSTGNSSAFSTCSNIQICDPIEGVLISGDTEYCIGGSVDLSASSTTPGVIFDYKWYLNDVLQASLITATISADQPGTWRVVIGDVRDPELCKDSIETDVVENENTNTLNATGPISVCDEANGLTFDVTGGTTGSSYTWSSVDSKIDLNPTVGVDLIQVIGNVVSGSSGDAVVQVIETDLNDCPSTAGQVTVTIIGLPDEPIIDGERTVLCEGSATYTISSTTTGLMFNWTIPIGASITASNTDSTSITVLFGTDGGTITAIPITIDGGCIGLTPASADISLTGCDILASFTTDVAAACIGDVVVFTDSSVVDAGLTISTWQWDFGPNATPQTMDSEGPHNVVFSTSGDQTVTLIIKDSGVPQAEDDTVRIAVTINENTNTLDVTGPATVCDGEPGLTFDVTGGNIGSEYTWDAGDAQLIVNNTGGQDVTTTTADIVLGSSGSTSIMVTETDVNGCDATDDLIVPITALPSRPLIVGDNSVLCDATETYTIQTPESGVIYNWTAPVGAVITSLDAPFNTEVSIDFSMTQGLVIVIPETQVGGCVGVEPDTMDVTLTGCGLQAAFVGSGTSACLGNVITFTDRSTPPENTGVIDSWAWDFGPDATPQTADTEGPHEVVYSSTDPQTVTLTITGDGSSSTAVPMDIQIFENTNVLVVEGPGEVCEEEQALEFFVTNPTVGSNYAWSNPVGDLTILNLGGVDEDNTTVNVNPSFTGIATVKVIETDANGCEIEGSADVNVNALPNAPTITGQVTALCMDDSITYQIGSPITGVNYLWTVPSDASIIYSSGSDSSLVSVRFGVISGDIIVTPVLDIAGCVGVNPDTLSVQLTGCNLNVEFSYDSSRLCIGDPIAFTDLSSVDAPSDLATWTWDFGSEATPQFQTGEFPDDVSFSTVGPHDVKLIVTDNSSPVVAIDSITYRVSVNTNPIAATITGPQTVCEGAVSTYTVDPSDTVNFDYVFSSTSTSTVINRYRDSVDVLAGASNYSVIATVTDVNGCDTDASYPVVVNIVPELSSINTPLRICDQNSVDDFMLFTISSDYVNTDPNFNPWSANPDIFSDPGTLWNPVGDTAIQIIFGDYTGVFELTYTVDAPDCGDGVTVVSTSSSFVVQESQRYDVSINQQRVCVGDSSEYGVTWTINDVVSRNTDGSIRRYTGFTYEWWRDLDSLEYTSDTAMVTNHQIGDSLSLEVTLPETLCYHNLSDTTDSYDPLDVIDRPGASLWVDELDGVSRVGNETDHILVLTDLVPIELFDNTSRLLDLAAASEYTFILSETLKNEAEDGSDSIHVIDPNGSVISLADGQNYKYAYLAYDQDTTVYKLLVSNGVCWDSSEVRVVIDYNIFIPNVFTPNGDGTYDTWWIKNIDQFPNNKVTVYNRWGNIVYDEAGYDNETVVWLGEKDGESLPFGTYYYIVDLGNGADPFSGYVSIIK